VGIVLGNIYMPVDGDPAARQSTIHIRTPDFPGGSSYLEGVRLTTCLSASYSIRLSVNQCNA
ncbi:hypothetical protein ACC685_38170, partial [Rhizobium ruizarguesonis]